MGIYTKANCSMTVCANFIIYMAMEHMSSDACVHFMKVFMSLFFMHPHACTREKQTTYLCCIFITM